MSIEPLLNASFVVQLHVASALMAFLVGTLQLVAPKGTLSHRMAGWFWVVVMAVVCGSSFLIHELRIWGSWSPIHLLAGSILVALIFAVAAARRHAVQQHRLLMIAIFFVGLVVTGFFTLAPGRIMNAIVF